MATRVEQQTVDYESLNKNDKDLKNLIKEIDELKDNNLRNDKIEGGVLLENNLNNSLDKTLRHCDKKILNALVTEVGKINLSKGNVKGLNTLVAALNTIKVSRETESLAKFRTKITSGQLDDLNHLDKEDIQNVLDCIDGMSRSDALKLYSDMTVALQSQHNNFKSTDQKYFYSVYEKIENTVNDGKPLQLNESDVTDAELREIFYDGLQASRLGEIFKQYIGTDWEGGNINWDFVLKKSETQRFTAKEFADKFNEANDKRIGDVDSKVKDLIEKADINGITTVNADGTFKKGGQNITIEDILGITVTDLKGLDILNITELQGEHFADKRAERTNAIKAKIEAKDKQENGEFVEGKKGGKTVDNVNKINSLFSGSNEVNQFIKIEKNANNEDVVKYNVKKAKDYINSGLIKYRPNDDVSRKAWNGEILNKPDDNNSLAWFAATQILLNEFDKTYSLALDGVLGDDTKKATTLFQEKYNKDHNLVENNKNRLATDGKPGPNTVIALLTELDKTTQSETVVPNRGGIGSPETEKPTIFFNGRDDFNLVFGMTNPMIDDLGINADGSVYMKKDSSDKNYYYQSGNDIVRVSTDTPWIKQKQVPGNNGALDDDEWTSDVNVCKEGETKLNGLFNKQSGALKDFIGNDVTVGIEESNYVLQNGNTKITLDKAILADNFCGKTNIEDKMKLVYLASSLKNDSYAAKIGDDNKARFERSYLNDQNLYGLNAENEFNFIDFYNGLFEQSNPSA